MEELRLEIQLERYLNNVSNPCCDKSRMMERQRYKAFLAIAL